MDKFIPGKTRIPASSPVISAEDIETLHECVDRKWYTEHFYCKAFSDDLKNTTNKKHCQLVNSGSSASLVAIMALTDSKVPKSAVITTALAFPTTIAPIYQSGHIPYYIDVDPYTLEPDYEQIDFLLDNRIDIIGGIFTHTLGFPHDERKIHMLLGNNCFHISDCCDALGACLLYDEVPDCGLGFYADVCLYSFFPAHHITTGEGGAILTNKDEYAEQMRSLANWGRSCYCKPGQQNVCGCRFDWPNRGKLPEGYDHKYIFDRLGYNLKMTEFQGALGWSQLQSLGSETVTRRWNYEYLGTNIGAIFDGEISFIDVPDWSYPSPFGLPILVEEEAPFTASDLIQFLEERKISTRRVFAGNITLQPGYMNLPYMSKPLDGTNRIMSDMFWVGCGGFLTKKMMDYMIDSFGDFYD